MLFGRRLPPGHLNRDILTGLIAQRAAAQPDPVEEPDTEIRAIFRQNYDLNTAAQKAVHRRPG
jgi:hypothetical protein